MALLTEKELRAANLVNILYDPARFWVEFATTSGVSGAFPVRMSYPVIDDEGQKMQRNEVRAKVLMSVWASPENRDVVTINGADWKVAEVIPLQTEWELVLESGLKLGFGR